MIADLRQGLATNLAAIPEVQVSAYILSNPTPPTIWVAGISTEYDRTMGRRVTGGKYTDEYTALVQGFVPFTEDVGHAMLLDTFLAASGTFSVKAAIEADRTLAGAADDCWVSAATQPQLSTFLTMSLLLAEWTVTIIAAEVAL